MEEKNITASRILSEVIAQASTDFIVQVVARGGANGNIKVRGTMIDSVKLSDPNNNNDNAWAYLNLDKNSEKVETVDGNTGIDITADGTIIFEVNVNSVHKFAVDLSITSGEFDVYIINYDNR